MARNGCQRRRWSSPRVQLARFGTPSALAAAVFCCRAALAGAPGALADEDGPFYFTEESEDAESEPSGNAESDLGPQLGSSVEHDGAVPGIFVNDAVLAPGMPYEIKVNIGQVKFLPFSCMGGPADVVISLSTYSVDDDPLLFLSLNINEAPTFLDENLSSFAQWREDSIGNHYVIAQAVGPQGGIVGLMNVKHFAGETLDGILSIRCSAIIAFDALFWDHLRDSAVCPMGLPSTAGDNEFCSGHGRCRKDAVCDCDADYTGPACWSQKSDMTVASRGYYDFQLASGEYRYFRVHVPKSFPGGYLDVKLDGGKPLVLLVGRDHEPTKSSYELSNFDDWINGRNESSLQFKIEGTGLVQPAASQASQAPPVEEEVLLPPDLGLPPPRRLKAEQCPEDMPELTDPSCMSPEYAACQDACVGCMQCKRLRSAVNDSCAAGCTMCESFSCSETLSQCAGSWTCSGKEAGLCNEKCSSCWGCMDSNDPQCAERCSCCPVCLPLAAKCDLLPSAASTNSRWVIVGVFSPRWHHADRVDDPSMQPVHAIVEIALKVDPLYEQKQAPKSWVADLYDPFQDLQSLTLARSMVYPDGQPFLYKLDVSPGKRPVKKRVRLYRDRMTLMVVRCTNRWPRNMRLSLKAGDDVSHVLLSARAAPKTMFDFEQVHMPVEGVTHIFTERERQVWCAIFGKVDGWASISAITYSRPTSDLSPPMSPGGALTFILTLFSGLMILCFIYGGGLGKIWACCCKESDSDSAPLSQRFSSLVRMGSMDDAQAALNRGASFTEGPGMDARLEDQYLHRGGFGDDGI